LRQLAIRLACLQDLPERIIQHVALQVEVQEARAGNLGMVKPAALNALHQFFRNLARILMEHAGRLHRKIRGKIAKLLLRRHFKNNIRQFPFRENTFSHSILCCLLNSSSKCIFDIQKQFLLLWNPAYFLS
jgi:hypothetical protein